MTRPAKRITSADVARAAGVSRTTVSFVLNDRPGQSIPEETRRRVLEAARDLDYRPHASARALAAGRSDIVLLSVPDVPIGPSISRFVEELAAALGDHGLTLVTHLTGARGRPLPDVCATLGAMAVIGLGAFDDATADALHRAGASLVLPTEDAASAMSEIGRIQAEHLVGRGHRRLGYALPTDPVLRPMARSRLDGAARACAAAGIDLPVALETGMEIADAARAVAGWTEQGVTGVCAFNDEIAMAVLAGMRDRGLAAPADIAVIGADDIPTARLAAPPLTTVAFDLREVGRHRAEAVAAGLAGNDSHPVLARTYERVIERSST
ncbi:LacI family DNA-binding transcriptional regulator [Actinomadura sp. WMMB 499]|uniref:LacI family DNA-binding transcriptional regulator n=1 Tax=Actinomadura sp. WMMB 499 TaxID=1219491 RepID=UPI001244CA85|nr:LacI family DNA-binding transcriptional regulator [Actinomadura sp. WMMB 499]QFG22156.1 LacI family transcriptional regulator [Actinomadura sp. WMMB 499]